MNPDSFLFAAATTSWPLAGPMYDPRPSSSRTKGAAFVNAKLSVHERDRKRLERERQRAQGGRR